MPVPGSDSSANRIDSKGDAAKEAGFFAGGPRRLVTSLLLFGLFTEWLLPLRQLTAYTELYRISPVIAAIGCFLAVGLLVPPLWISLLLNSAVCLVTVLLLFGVQTPSLADAFVQLVAALRDDAAGVLEGTLSLSGETRTLMLITGIGMMAAAIQSLVWLRQWGPGLALLTGMYLLALSAIFGIDVLPGLIRTSVEGLVLGMLLTVPRVERLLGPIDSFKGRGRQLAGWPSGWWSAAAWAVVLLMAGGLWTAYRAEPSDKQAPWAVDAIDWGTNRLLDRNTETAMNSREEGTPEAGSGLGGSGLTGYSFDDRYLGESIRPDRTELFKVLATRSAYLRGESKDTYEGQGWTQSRERLEWLPLPLIAAAGSAVRAAGITDDGAEDSGPVLRQTVTALYPSPGWPLFSAGADARVISLQPVGSDAPAARGYRADEAAGALYPETDNQRIGQYTVETKLPNLRAESAGASGSVLLDPEDIVRDYTQLPASLPARVGELAGRIAATADGERYEIVQAVEAYLRSHYRYTLQDTKTPPAGEDFVDHFLFEQKQGYCVHFATAMAVLLRTQGIPARYVKGFAASSEQELEAGQRADEQAEREADGGAAGAEGIGTGNSAGAGSGNHGGNGDAAAAGIESGTGAQLKSYTVLASDAHAWVEVYFPGVGWVAFEPTPGFTGPAGEPGPGGGGAAAADSAAALKQGMTATAGEAAAADSGARAPGRVMRAAAQLQAAAMRAADTAAREAAALAQAVRSAAAGRLWATAALAAGAIAAAAVLAAAWRRRERYALAAALRKYGRAQEAGRRIAARAYFLALADACWRELQAGCGAREAGRTAREYAAALNLPPHSEEARLVADFVSWDEEARYNDDWIKPPSVDQLEQLISIVQQGSLVKAIQAQEGLQRRLAPESAAKPQKP
ncbi:transglutaminase domain-containing protein [Paenibacillus nasutitermitis]|uniref:Transglutaminase-like domain-containing protein n=1 Tax=Paenibacillus nasutitermitis TaxID=1652958 RepID=A0A916ZCD6_9BACL|nr:transglutaminase domain-containing protein [Paenibacillus nasutitermitis]GGD87898.1 hypothetical protein GCM10010911_52930 [Paenibacillus nasutitermitis]